MAKAYKTRTPKAAHDRDPQPTACTPELARCAKCGSTRINDLGPTSVGLRGQLYQCADCLSRWISIE